MTVINWTIVLSSSIYAVIGILIYALGFIIMDWLTPYELWKEINERKNVALAIFLGAIAIGIAIIVAAAIHG
jgi:uncharacterized membrane protein YjfL (UPF0719 family)